MYVCMYVCMRYSFFIYLFIYSLNKYFSPLNTWLLLSAIVSASLPVCLSVLSQETNYKIEKKHKKIEKLKESS